MKSNITRRTFVIQSITAAATLSCGPSMDPPDGDSPDAGSPDAVSDIESLETGTPDAGPGRDVGGIEDATADGGPGSGVGGSPFTQVSAPTLETLLADYGHLFGHNAPGRPAYDTSGAVMTGIGGLRGALQAMDGTGGKIVLTESPSGRFDVTESGTAEQPIEIMAPTEHGLVVTGANGFLVVGQHVKLRGFHFRDMTGESVRFEDRSTPSTSPPTPQGDNVSGTFCAVTHCKFTNMPGGMNSVTIKSHDFEFAYNDCTEIGDPDYPFLYIDGPGVDYYIDAPKRGRIHHNTARDGFTWLMLCPSQYVTGFDDQPVGASTIGLLRQTGCVVEWNDIGGTWGDPEILSIKGDGVIFRYNLVQTTSPSAHISTRMGHDVAIYGNILNIQNNGSDLVSRAGGYRSSVIYNLAFTAGGSLANFQGDIAWAPTGPYYGRYGGIDGVYRKNIVIGPSSRTYRVLADAWATGMPGAVKATPNGNTLADNLFLGHTPTQQIDPGTPMTVAEFSESNTVQNGIGGYAMTGSGPYTTSTAIHPNMAEIITVDSPVLGDITVDPADIPWLQDFVYSS